MVTIDKDSATLFVTGRKSAIAASAGQLSATAEPAARGVILKAAADNTTTVYVGPSTVTADAADATDGYPLAPGEAVLVPCDALSDIYLIGSGSGPAKVFWLL